MQGNGVHQDKVLHVFHDPALRPEQGERDYRQNRAGEKRAALRGAAWRNQNSNCAVDVDAGMSRDGGSRKENSASISLISEKFTA